MKDSFKAPADLCDLCQTCEMTVIKENKDQREGHWENYFKVLDLHSGESCNLSSDKKTLKCSNIMAEIGSVMKNANPPDDQYPLHAMMNGFNTLNCPNEWDFTPKLDGSYTCRQFSV